MANPYDVRKAIVNAGYRNPINTNQMNRAVANTNPFLTTPSNRQQPITRANNMGGMMPSNRQPQMNQFNNKPRNNTPPNYTNNLLDYILSPQGKGMAQGLLESSGYSTKPVGMGEALARGLARSNEAQALTNEKSYKDALLELQKEELEIKKNTKTQTKANTQTYVNKKGDTLTLDLNNPNDQQIMRTEEFKNNFVEMSLQTDETPTVIPPSAKKNVGELFGNAKTLVQNITDYQTQLTNPEALTSSSLSSFVLTIDNIKTLTEQAGGLFKNNTGNEQSNIDDFFAKTEKTLDNKIQTNNAGTTGILKSTAVQIAYDYAKQNNPDGKISERDFDNALKILTAGGISDKNALIVNSERLKNNAVRSFKNNVTGIKGANNLGENTFSDLVLDLDTELKNSPFATFDNNKESTESATSITIDLDTL
jgi:hypothetical protein